MGAAIYAADVATLRLSVKVIGIRGIGEHPKAVTAKHIFPLRVGDAAGILRLADPGTVVLQTAVDLEGIVVVDADVVELRDGEVFAFPPFAATVVRIPHAAIVPGGDRLRIGRIDPNIMEIAMRTLKTADDGETLARIFAQDQRTVGLEETVRIFRINDQVREVERTPDHPIALIALVPRRAAIIGDKERAVGGFDKGINTFCIRGRDCDCDTTVGLLRKTPGVLRRDFRPGRAAVGRPKQTAARRRVRALATGTEGPALAPEVP